MSTRDKATTPTGAERPSGRANGFDPLGDLLVAQERRPQHLTTVNLRTLSPFQRALLVIDGTVTKFIEAYTMEPVQVALLGENTRELEADHPWLEVPRGTRVIAREVLLLGKQSRVFHAYAASLLVVDRLPARVREDLKVNPGGIGRVLLDHQLETRREVLWYGRERMDVLPAEVEPLSDGRFLSRTYRVISGKPMMMINEKFPLDAGMLSHH